MKHLTTNRCRHNNEVFRYSISATCARTIPCITMYNMSNEDHTCRGRRTHEPPAQRGYARLRLASRCHAGFCKTNKAKSYCISQAELAAWRVGDTAD